MKAVEKAIWYVESHYREAISLDTLASVAGVSRYHLSRMFCYAVGLPVSKYLRIRRLSAAAIALAAGEPDILDLALSLGYGSHEAFSRAFKELFAATPEQVRAQGHTDNLKLLEPQSMETSTSVSLAEPRSEKLGPISLIGHSRHYPFEKVSGIPEQWQAFAEVLPTISNDPKPTTFGVIYNGCDDSFDYLSGVDAKVCPGNVGNVVKIELESQTYLVFDHTSHVSSVRETCAAIWSNWLPNSDVKVIEAPWFERYGKSFDPITGNGGLEIWIPIIS